VEFLLILLVLAIAVAVVAWPLRSSAASRPPEPGRQPDGAALEAAKEAKYREIRDAELDYRTGKLSEGDWRALDASLRAEALELLRRADALEAVELRPLAADDPVAQRLLGAFAAEIAGLYPGWDPDQGPRATPADFGPPGGRLVVAYRDGAAVGCGGVKHLDAHTGEIKRLYVAPEVRGHGVARRLLDDLEVVARELGYARVRLDTGPRQPDALALFRGAGYRDIEDYNANPAATHWLEKDLD
jgi:ribosomal protein S18 acetylase RimI-like enzyme